MKKTFLFSLFFYSTLIWIPTQVNAQVNLIPDPSFEDTTGTINGSVQLSLHTWRNLDSTNHLNASAYLSHYSQYSDFLLPNQTPIQWIYQNARTGGGGVAIESVWSASSTWKRTLVRTQLKSTLVQGKTYCAKMYVNPFDKSYSYFSDGIAMYFDNGQLDTIMAIDSSGVYPFVQPQVSNPNNNVISDTLNWTLVSGTFVATGNESFLTIGNFKSDSNTVRSPNWAIFDSLNIVNGSGFLVEDVSVVAVDMSAWLQDASCTLGDSVYIGLPKYELPDAQWYNLTMQSIGTGGGLYVTPTQAQTQYIQAIDVCNSIIYDTLTVFAYPVGFSQLEEKNKSYRIFPNPSSDKIFIELKINNLEFRIKNLQILNLQGQVLLQEKNNNEVDISSLSSGVYFLQLTNERMERLVYKVIKE